MALHIYAIYTELRRSIVLGNQGNPAILDIPGAIDKNASEAVAFFGRGAGNRADDIGGSGQAIILADVRASRDDFRRIAGAIGMRRYDERYIPRLGDAAKLDEGLAHVGADFIAAHGHAIAAIDNQ